MWAEGWWLAQCGQALSQALSQALLPRPCPRCPLCLLSTQSWWVGPAGQVLPGSLPELAASRTLATPVLFLERRTSGCSRNGPRRSQEIGPGSHRELWENHGHTREPGGEAEALGTELGPRTCPPQRVLGGLGGRFQRRPDLGYLVTVLDVPPHHLHI